MIFSDEEQSRYQRQLDLPGIGEEGQLKLREARILVIGAGGLGCPALLYLSAAGVGTIGIVDGDVVELTNLHRQVLYTGADIGKNKSLSAIEHLRLRNPHVHYDVYPGPLTPLNAEALIKEYDLVLDCTDNFPARYLVNDTCVLLGKTWIYGSVRQFAGQASVFNLEYPDGSRSGTMRCLFPVPPAAAGNCNDEGVIGVIPGMIGIMMAGETIKLITGTEIPLAGTLLTLSAQSMQTERWQFVRNESLWDMPDTLADMRQWNYENYAENCDTADSISPEAFRELLMLPGNEVLVLDVRELHEKPRITDFAVMEIPLSNLKKQSVELKARKWNVILCTTGSRSRQAVSILSKSDGTAQWSSLEGGLDALMDPIRQASAPLAQS